MHSETATQESAIVELETYMVPPRSLELSVMMTEPNQMITKTSANWGPPSSLLSADPPCNNLKTQKAILLSAGHVVPYLYCVLSIILYVYNIT